MRKTQEMLVLSLGQEDPLEKGMATLSSILAWRIPWTEKPGGLQSKGLRRVRHHRVTQHTHMAKRTVTQWKSLQQKRLGAKMSTAKTLQKNRWTHFKPGLENTKNRKRWGWIVGQGLVHVKPWQCKSFAVICHNEQCSKDRSVSEVSPLT